MTWSLVTGLGTLPMQAPKLAVQELKRCVEELGLAGVQIGSHINDWTLDREEIFQVFKAGSCAPGAADGCHVSPPARCVARSRGAGCLRDGAPVGHGGAGPHV